jgi:hypothetical protein
MNFKSAAENITPNALKDALCPFVPRSLPAALAVVDQLNSSQYDITDDKHCRQYSRHDNVNSPEMPTVADLRNDRRFVRMAYYVDNVVAWFHYSAGSDIVDFYLNDGVSGTLTPGKLTADYGGKTVTVDL